VNNPEAPLKYLILKVSLTWKSATEFHSLKMRVVGLNYRDEFFVRLYDKNEIRTFQKLGETEFVKRKNEENFEKLLKRRNALEERRATYDDKNDPEVKSIGRSLSELKRWIGIYSDWFLAKGYDIPGRGIAKKTHEEVSKKDYPGPVYLLAYEFRERTNKGEFPSYNYAYKKAAERFTIKDKEVTWKQLKSAYDSASSKGNI
jgi:hypothetical protein